MLYTYYRDAEKAVKRGYLKISPKYVYSIRKLWERNRLGRTYNCATNADVPDRNMVGQFA